MQSVDVVQQVAPQILSFVGFEESALVRRLETDEYGIEAGVHQRRHQRGSSARFDGRLGVEFGVRVRAVATA